VKNRAADETGSPALARLRWIEDRIATIGHQNPYEFPAKARLG
jgi:hypothetical protein